MARIELPSGNWIEYREKLMAADKFAVQNSIILTISDEKGTDVTGGLQNNMRNALLTQIITSWSFDVPIPSVNAGGDIGMTLDLDDYNAIQAAVEPLMEKISFIPPRAASSK
jgi:hypothetical protein